MKIKYFAEIGLNYLGNPNYIKKYIEKLDKTGVDGVTIQILNDSFYKKRFKNYKLSYKEIKKFVFELKRRKKLVGIATNDLSKIEYLKNLDINFYKILSSGINNIKMIEYFLKTNCSKVYLSTGMANVKQLSEIINKIKNNKKKLSLIHTSFKKNRTHLNLNRINILRKKFKLPVCYGNHSKYLKSLIDVKKYSPYAIFFYIKFKEKMKYPDNIHALNIENLSRYI